MAASRPANFSFAHGRISFGRITEHLEIPNLVAVQTGSFDRLIGNDAAAHGGLADVLDEISPIEDFSGTMSLSFSTPRFDEVKASIAECKEKDQTYCAPLFVTAEFTNHTTGEIKSQTVFMGDFPMMTPKGTFIINRTERVVVSQLVRSPGVYFTKEPDKTSDRDLFSVRVIPNRGAWLEFDIDKRDTVGVRIDRKRRQAVPILLKAIGWTNERIRERFGWSEPMMTTLEKDHVAGRDEALLDIYRRLRPGEPPTRYNAQTLLDNLFFNPKRYDLARVGRYKFNPPRLDPAQPRRPAARRPVRQGTALRRALRRAVPRPDRGRLHLHPEARPPGRRQDPRPFDRAVFDDHPAAAG